MTLDRRRTSTREQLTESAIVLFRRQGVSGTGIDEVCRRAGVTKGVFAHHFPGGKRELVAAAVEHNAADVRKLLAGLAERSDGSVPDIVRSFFATYARLFRKHGWAYGCPVAAAVVEAGAEEDFAAGAAFASWRAALRDLDPMLGAGVDALVVAAFEGAILQARADRDPDIFDQVGQSLARLIESVPPSQEQPA